VVAPKAIHIRAAMCLQGARSWFDAGQRSADVGTQAPDGGTSNHARCIQVQGWVKAAPAARWGPTVKEELSLASLAISLPGLPVPIKRPMPGHHSETHFFSPGCLGALRNIRPLISTNVKRDVRFFTSSRAYRLPSSTLGELASPPSSQTEHPSEPKHLQFIQSCMYPEQHGSTSKLLCSPAWYRGPPT
jgi:hypothetical protein